MSDRQIELGIGIHGEPGTERTAIKSVDEITEILTRSLLEDAPYSRTLREWDEDKGEWEDIELTNLPFAKGDRSVTKSFRQRHWRNPQNREYDLDFFDWRCQ